MIKIQSHWNFVLDSSGMEYPVGVSMTVPDETMSIQDLMDRFIKGQRVPDNLFRPGGFDEGSDFDSDDLEKLGSMDLVDRADVVERLKGVQSAKQGELDALKKRQDVVARDEKKRQKSLSGLLLTSKKKGKKVAAGPRRSGEQKRPSKGADEGSE